MLWYNTKTKELQSNKPYTGFIREDLIPTLYPDWLQVEDDFVPIIELTLEQKISNVEQEYNKKLKEFEDLIIRSIATDSDLVTLKSEYKRIADEKDLAIVTLIESEVV